MVINPKVWILTGALVAGLTLGAAPAYADDSDACWLNADTGIVQCFDDTDELADAVLEQTGAPLVREDDGLAFRGARANYVLAELFTGTSYTGSVFQVSSVNSALCSGSSISGNLPGAYNNSVSSFRSFLGCTTKIWDLTGQAGDTFGAFVSATSVSSLDNRASSFRVE